MNTIIFDLDGTLLPMDITKFIDLYNKALAAAFIDLAEPKEMIKNLWASTKHTIMNVNDKKNFDVFFEDFSKRMPGNVQDFIDRFSNFYDKEFSIVQGSTTVSNEIIEAVKVLKQKGYRLIIATNPMLPLKSNHIRIGWAGLDVSDFDYISNMELNTSCKPHLSFYEEVIEHNDIDISKTLMVGNDVQEDLVVSKLGMKTYLINDCLINREESYSTDYESDYAGFLKFVHQLAPVT